MRRIKHFSVAMLALASLTGSESPVWAKPQPAETRPLFYAEIADVATRAPIVAIATITSAKWLHRELAVNVPPGHARFLVTAQVTSLLRGDRGLQERIEYLFDAPLDAANRPPKLRKQKVLIAATPFAGNAAMVRLVSASAQLPWSPDAEATTRAILAELLAPNAPPRITGIAGAFHVRGSLPGESETQIFLKTSTERPVSLSILRRPGEAPRWAVSLGEMVDETAPTTKPDTLLWYRLACSLPDALPVDATADLAPEDAAAAAADYHIVLDGLGPCRRAPTR